MPSQRRPQATPAKEGPAPAPAPSGGASSPSSSTTRGTARMTPATSRQHAEALAASSAEEAATRAAEDAAAPWNFNPRLHLIAHETQDCEECYSWVSHYTEDLIAQSPSLLAAEVQRDNTIRGPLVAEHAALRASHDSVRATNDTLQREVAALRDDLERTRSELERVRSERDDADDDLRRLRRDYDDMDRRHLDTIAGLRAELDQQPSSSPRRRKVARRGSATSPSSREPSSQSRPPSRPASPMLEDSPAPPATRSASAASSHSRTLAEGSVAGSQPRLLRRMPSSAASSSSSALPAGDLIHRIADPVALGDAPSMPPPSAPAFAPTPIVPGMGFPSLLPVVHYGSSRETTVVQGTATTRPDGSVDMHAHPRFVLAIEGRDSATGGPAWTTLLVRREMLTSEAASRAREARVPLPLGGHPGGGRDGVLIAPNDPKTQEAVDELFAAARTNTRAYGRAMAFVERIRYTPPEIRHEFYNRVLNRWREWGLDRRGAPPAEGPEAAPDAPEASTSTTHGAQRRRMQEPGLDADNFVWKRWL
jgi:hypothetical protein